jgi:hypothetical protein
MSLLQWWPTVMWSNLIIPLAAAQTAVLGDWLRVTTVLKQQTMWAEPGHVIGWEHFDLLQEARTVPGAPAAQMEVRSARLDWMLNLAMDQSEEIN